MKAFHSIRLVVAFLVSVAAFGLSGRAQATSTAQKVFDSMVEALGGQTFLDVKEIQTSGRYFTFKRNEVAGSDLYAEYVRFPDMRRLEFGKDKYKTIRINDGEEGWNVVPPPNGKGGPDVQPQTPRETQEFLDEFKTGFEYVVRFVARAPKASLVNSGSELLEYKRVDVLEIRDPEKNLLRIYVDREAHLPVKVLMRRADESRVTEENYANWHRFDGVMTPLMIVQYRDGVKVQEVRAEKVAYNPGLADSLFAPPAKTAK